MNIYIYVCIHTHMCNIPSRLRPTCMTKTIGIMRRERLQNIPDFCNQKIIQNHRKYEKHVQQKYPDVLCQKNRNFKLGHRNNKTESKTNTYTSQALKVYHISLNKTRKQLQEALEHSESMNFNFSNLVLVIQDFTKLSVLYLLRCC